MATWLWFHALRSCEGRDLAVLGGPVRIPRERSRRTNCTKPADNTRPQTLLRVWGASASLPQFDLSGLPRVRNDGCLLRRPEELGAWSLELGAWSLELGACAAEGFVMHRRSLREDITRSKGTKSSAGSYWSLPVGATVSLPKKWNSFNERGGLSGHLMRMTLLLNGRGRTRLN